MMTMMASAVRLFYFLLSTTLIASAATTYLYKREEGLRCDARADCVSWYTTGSASCRTGYTGMPYEAKGYSVGSYCEKPCSKEQEDTCASDKCTFFSSECNKYPGSSICGNAITWCDAPKAMPKASCTHIQLGFAVVYDEETGMCAADKNPDTSEHYLRYVMQKGPVDLGLFMSCAPVTLAGADSVTANITATVDQNLFQGCSEVPDPGEYEQKWSCPVDKSKFDAIEKAGRAACANADYPGNIKPEFNANKG